MDSAPLRAKFDVATALLAQLHQTSERVAHLRREHKRVVMDLELLTNATEFFAEQDVRYSPSSIVCVNAFPSPRYAKCFAFRAALQNWWTL